MKSFLLYPAAITVMLLSQGQNAFGAETTEAIDEDMDTPTFSTPAQATHAANLAEAAAAEPNEATAAAQQAVADAQQALAEAEAAENLEAIDTATEALTAAEDAYATAIAELSGVLTSDIAAMRAEDMGWGQIAHELGVHPGLLGLGHTKRNRNRITGEIDTINEEAELAEATSRNPKSGWAKGHGLNTGNSSSADKGLGLAKGAQTKGNSAHAKGGSSASARDAGGGPGKSSGGKSNNGNRGNSKEKSNNGKANGKSK